MLADGVGMIASRCRTRAIAGSWAAVAALAALGPLACGGADTSTLTVPDAGGDQSLDVEVDGAPDGAADASAEALEEAGIDAAQDIAPDALPEAGPEAGSDCTGLADFTRCTIVTVPDRSYDICVDGVCVSPGCGTADCNAPGPHFKLGDTGQRDCYDAAGAVIGCSLMSGCTGLCGQDGQLGWDVANPKAARFTRTSGAEPTVVDEVTGLVWQGCAAGATGPTCTGTPSDMLWADALSFCDSLSWGTYDDWRLPDEYELHSILDYGIDKPALDAIAFPGTPNDWFVSSSTYAAIPDGAWFSMWYGTGLWGVVVPKEHPDSAGKVRCVRDGILPALDLARFERKLDVPGQPVVRDHVTDLEWQGCAAGFSGDDCLTGKMDARTWAGALAACEDLDWGGFSDWHLPDIKQLRSMIDNRRTNPGVSPIAFPNTPDLPAWSSTTNVADTTTAWSVTIGFGGGVQEAGKSAGTLALRCVRVP